MADQGITVFVTTHYMEEAEYCDRIALIYDGRMIASGSPMELKTRFMHDKIIDLRCADPQDVNCSAEGVCRRFGMQPFLAQVCMWSPRMTDTATKAINRSPCCPRPVASKLHAWRPSCRAWKMCSSPSLKRWTEQRQRTKTRRRADHEPQTSHALLPEKKPCICCGTGGASPWPWPSRSSSSCSTAMP